MKHLIRTVLLSTLLFITLLASAQITEARIKYDVKIDSDDPVMQQQMSMMSGSTMEMAFKDKSFRQEMDMKMMKTTTIYDGKSEESIVLLDLMGMKKAAKLDDLKEAGGSGSTSDSATIEMTDETKKIAGYDCKKVIITDTTGAELIMYVTDQIKPQNNQNKYGSDKVNGFPLQIEVENEQMTMTMTATEVSKKVDKKLFKVAVPEGYEEMKGEELMNMLGGMK